MRKFLMVSLGLAFITYCGTAKAQSDRYSVNYNLTACRNATNENNSDNLFLQGICSGRVQGVAFAFGGEHFCIPESASNGQMVKVVVAYLDRIPHRHHENFMPLAVEALKAAWPCTRR